ncbi:hypothetical protein CYLTODRAFT_399519 [Cylindrobasidium torrendii FP15055 ss-10]|uniref:Calcium-dependent phosphotriesterase n=1 Tax=Cylindrobasidium torrendii FP15055 ss-10 TaxID=1314674 RepID=A0A0D7B701_9AGAR|nr:hypothetical protein CYLTODRAFT_399519 [Cylindrobasidium torrendii FP15055 ss-10]
MLLPLLTTFAIGAGYTVLNPLLKTHGPFYKAHNFGRPETCTIYDQVEGCEKISLHADSGLLYLACTNLAQRQVWMNPTTELPLAKGVETNYVTIFDPVKGDFTPVELRGLDRTRSVAFHGMDVVPVEGSKDELYIYLVDHHLYADGTPPIEAYDSAVEVYKTKVGSNTADLVWTVPRNDALVTPNEVVGSGDAKSFYFTNDAEHPERADSPFDALRQYINPRASIGYCHVDEGCKIIMDGLLKPNGLATTGNGTFYIVDSLWTDVIIAEQREDGKLVQVDTIPTETISDNVSIDEQGSVWIAGLPNTIVAVKGMRDVRTRVPSRFIRASVGTAPNEKYHVENILQDDGQLLPFQTTVVHDSRRHKLYAHGLISPWLTACDFP